MTADRFDYSGNVGRAGSYGGHRSAFWPPVGSYAVSCTDLAAATPALGDAFLRGLAELQAAIDEEWRTAKEVGPPARTRFADPPLVASAMRAIAECLPGAVDRRAIELRAQAIEHGYHAAILAELAELEEEIAVVAGQVATWYGKQPGGLPTAFGCRRDDARQRVVAGALQRLDEVAGYLTGLHADLRLADVPAFAVTRVFFMAGEGNLHPKHIAYFLPADEGVTHSPFKKTYYFGNTHQVLLETLSLPLAARFLRVGRQLDAAGPGARAIPTLGVLGHEFGHSVHRPATGFGALHHAHRWASAVLQEVAADVFGILIAAELWAERLSIPREDVVFYYLAECLRYIDRGLGYFPDSDGMYLQLSYFVQIGALAVERDGGPRLTGDPGTVLAALRSLARVLVDELRRSPSRSVEYVQEHIHSSLDSVT